MPWTAREQLSYISRKVQKELPQKEIGETLNRAYSQLPEDEQSLIAGQAETIKELGRKRGIGDKTALEILAALGAALHTVYTDEEEKGKG